MKRLSLVIGASSGVGAATARKLHERGWQVVITARNAEKLRRVAESVESSVAYFPCDASTSLGTQSLAHFVREQYGIPELIVNAAGVGQWKRIEDTSPEEAVQMIQAPYLAAFNASQAFMSDMLQRKRGVLIHINSPACFMPWPSAVGYTAARFALRGLHQALCQDLVGTGVHSCHVVFGRIDSEYFTNNPGVLDHMPKIASTVRTLSCDECASVIAKLAERPRRETVYPWMLRMYYWNNWMFPWLTRWLLRATAT
ncbi:MAG: SDR family oxidoreductase [bacterium]|nr:SDR family oxidoreductase [bacterium]